MTGPQDSRVRMDARLTCWTAAWLQLGVERDTEPLFSELTRCYKAPARAYHTLRHIDECLTWLGRARELAARPAEVEIALWFHDAVYDPHAKDNEEQSAAWARRAALESGASTKAADGIAELVRATAHGAAPARGDAALIADIDLAILAAAPGRFDEYELQVRQEYSWAPDAEFARARAAVLQRFAGREFIFATAFFRERCEEAARANLARSLARLSPTAD